MNPQHRKLLEQRLKEQQQHSSLQPNQRQSSSSPEPVKPSPKMKSNRV